MNMNDWKYQILRSDRKTLALQITPDGELLIRCPKRMGQQQILEFLKRKENWIEKHMRNLADNRELPKLSQQELQKLAENAAQVFPERVKLLAERAGVTYGRIGIRCQRTLWGSCSTKGNLNFNYLLLLAPPEVLDYVVAHELCHRKKMNHSAGFWAEVAALYPNYLQCRKWLKDHGPELMARLPQP